MVQSLQLFCAVSLLLTFGASALRPAEMDVDTQHLKPEDHEHASSLSELRPVDADALKNAIYWYFLRMETALPDGILNYNDPDGQAIAFFHSAGRQALNRVFIALCNMGSRDGTSLLKFVTNGGEVKVYDGSGEVEKNEDGTVKMKRLVLDNDEELLMRAILAMQNRMDWNEGQMAKLVLDLGKATDDDTKAGLIGRIQNSLKSYLKFLTDPEAKNGYAVPIYRLWKKKAAWATLAGKFREAGLTYPVSDVGQTLERDLEYLCTVVETRVVGRGRDKFGAPLPSQIVLHPSPFIVIGKYDLEQVWTTAGLEGTPTASFAVTGTTAPADWNTDEWDAGENDYEFPLLS
mmetsp:Transcript_1728/g.4427  ORF Transcript_1728/g.4427 Transcript_1728/m.4427 type:complete len:347 (+) Transcript_1728:122-1162(+)